MQKLSKIAQTAQNCPKEPKSVHSVQNCPEVPKLNNFYQEFSFGTPCVCTVVSYDYEFSLIHRVIRATLWFHAQMLIQANLKHAHFHNFGLKTL